MLHTSANIILIYYFLHRSIHIATEQLIHPIQMKLIHEKNHLTRF